MANIINVTVDDSNDIINVTVSDGVFTASGGGTFIDGYLVSKGAGNNSASIEVGDYISGWIGDVWISGKVTTVPVNDVSDVDPAIQGEIL